MKVVKKDKDLSAVNTMKQAKFRFLNESLYTTASSDAKSMFAKEPELFTDYHEGYRQQVEKWPKNPLDMFIDELSKSKYKNYTIADFGCGEGRLETDLKAKGHKGTIKSFDVGKCADHVIQTDIKSVPLKNNCVDVGVFSLSLMGVNFPDFLVEANRVLKAGGTLFIAEVLSRFTNVSEFVKHMKHLLTVSLP